jgi:dihydroorotate dehydrogenase
VVYERLVRPLLFRSAGGDAEAVHERTLRALTRLAAYPRLVAPLAAYHGGAGAERTVFGVRFPGPVGLAAGMDKNGVALGAWPALGFGFAELGTVTWHAQPGNPRPRLFRLPASEAVINRMGFNNGGATALAARLRALGPLTVPLGVSIGKSKVTPVEEAVEDYRSSLEVLAPYADYFAVNVSSPNTPGLRDLQAVEQLEPIVAAVRAGMADAGVARVPLLVKIAPDLADDDVDAVAGFAVRAGLDGLIATNTTIGREGLATPAAEVAAVGAGGLSGAPLAERSTAVLRRLRERVGPDLTIISVGGVEDAADVRARLAAGATLVQAYTAFVYGGPLWVRTVTRELAAAARAEGSNSTLQRP